MASISPALSRIKQDLATYLSDQWIEEACRAAGHQWRKRKLDPVATVHLFLLQVLNFNTAITHLRHLAKTPVVGSAYCKARMRLPLQALQGLLRKSAAVMAQATQPAGEEAGRFCGLRAFLVDGSSTITPDEPNLQKAFGQPSGCKAGCGFPVPKVLGLFDAFSGLIIELLAFPLFTHEQSKVWMLHPLLSRGDLLVGDCGFCSFAHLSMLWARGVHGLFRMHQKQIVDFRPHRKPRKKGQRGKPTSRFVKRLGRHDQIVRWKKPTNRPKWMRVEQYRTLPEELEVREIRYVIPRRGQRTQCVTLATTLLNPRLYPKEKIAELYNVRWRVEGHFAQLKTTLKMRKVKCKSKDGVQKELAIYCLAYNLIHTIMCQAALRQGVAPQRISFIDALRWLLSAQPGTVLEDLLVNPRRPDRHEPRVIKDLQDTYTKMCRPRAELRKALRRQKKAVM